MSTSGAAERSEPDARETSGRALSAADEPGAAAAAPAGGAYYLPNFCEGRMVFAVVLIAALVSVTLALARPSSLGFLSELARIALFVFWLGLTSAALLCAARRPLARLSIAAAVAGIFALLIANTLGLSALAVWLGRSLAARGLETGLFPSDYASFALRNAGICVIVVAMMLRYFYVSYEWRHHVRAEARSRIHALQARIRPHFLFNSMNTIASLTRTDPARAEEAVEDLADLFRVTLKDTDRRLTLKEELELSRIYQRIEMLRLGERLHVEWNVAELPMRAEVPGLIVQPLLENAIYHGIEKLDRGGTVEVSGRVTDGLVEISVANPYDAAAASGRRGNRLALDNIRERLALAYGSDGRLEVDDDEAAGRFKVTVRFPVRR